MSAKDERFVFCSPVETRWVSEGSRKKKGSARQNSPERERERGEEEGESLKTTRTRERIRSEKKYRGKERSGVKKRQTKEALLNLERREKKGFLFPLHFLRSLF